MLRWRSNKEGKVLKTKHKKSFQCTAPRITLKAKYFVYFCFSIFVFFAFCTGVHWGGIIRTAKYQRICFSEETLHQSSLMCLQCYSFTVLQCYTAQKCKRSKESATVQNRCTNRPEWSPQKVGDAELTVEDDTKIGINYEILKMNIRMIYGGTLESLLMLGKWQGWQSQFCYQIQIFKPVLAIKPFKWPDFPPSESSPMQMLANQIPWKVCKF